MTEIEGRGQFEVVQPVTGKAVELAAEALDLGRIDAQQTFAVVEPQLPVAGADLSALVIDEEAKRPETDRRRTEGEGDPSLSGVVDQRIDALARLEIPALRDIDLKDGFKPHCRRIGF